MFQVNGANQVGSGVLISKRRIMTAAHLGFVEGSTYRIQNGKGASYEATAIYICKDYDFTFLSCEDLPDFDPHMNRIFVSRLFLAR